MKSQNKIESEQWSDKAKDQYNRNRYSESIVSAIEAIEWDKDNPNGWWFSALNKLKFNEYDDAMEDLEELLELVPKFAPGWACYGDILKKTGAISRAKNALENAIKYDYDDKEIMAYKALAEIYKKNNSDDQEEKDKEINLLKKIENIEGLASFQLNRLGILCYQNKIFFDAIKYWEKNAQFSNEPASFFNLGLAYNHPEVSQDADAIDVWRLTEKRFPNVTSASKKIEEVLPRLISLGENVKKEKKTFLDFEEYYQHYVNPFELLEFPKNKINGSEDIDIKELQKLRKRLLQEIELEDGCVSWMNNFIFDKSQVINICDELYNNTKLKYHIQIYNNKPLLNFLSRGEHEHFVVEKNWSPLNTLEYLEKKDNGFREWISGPFSKQFNLVFSKAIVKENLTVIEALLDGRRWIDSSYIETCFEGARTKIDLHLEKLRKASEDSENQKPNKNKIEQLINEHHLLDMLNLFPTFFNILQDEAVKLVRTIAINCNKLHHDDELAKYILDLAKNFKFKSTKLNTKLQEDLEIIETNIETKKEKEFFLQNVLTYWSITKDGIQTNSKYITPDQVASVRWGITQVEQNITSYTKFFFMVKDYSKKTIKFKWESPKNKQKNTEIYNQILDAFFQFILPTMFEKWRKILNAGKTIVIKNNCILNNDGILIDTGVVFSREYHIPWYQLNIKYQEGFVFISDSRNDKKSISLSMLNVDNAVLLPIFYNIMNE